MLPSSQRLSVEQFDQVMEKGRVCHSSLFHMRWVLEKEAKKSRISAVAPQKIAKKAVERNKMRRQTYAVLQPLITELNASIFAIIFAKAGAKSARKEEISADLKNLFVKAGLIK